ncbi:MAG TPA: exodeoxyribonuclease VII large subunit [Xanthobacteraceae bacterium]|jgi:exodeoxyribonuclease VII large subunit
MAASTEPRTNLPEITVSELSANIKRLVEDNFAYVRLRGEISGFRGQHSSGHCYFSLKDDSARIDAVIWRTTFARIRFKPEEGLEVVATGRITTYPGKSSYQIVIDSLEPAGLGALMALLEERKKKLAAEGLFADVRKKPLPYLPRVVGVITSPTGAVIRDILHRISDRCPCRVLLWSVRVQGETSAAEVAAAIAGFNALTWDGAVPRPDVLIVARGGGSLEDLWSFNEEIVVRAVAASEIPLVSAVGHETDFTLIDFVSDLRAPTPTAAAEMVVPVRAELLTNVQGCGVRLAGGALRFITRLRADLRGLARGLPAADAILALPRQRLDSATARLPRALRANAHAHRVQLAKAAARLRPSTLQNRLHRWQERCASVAGRLEPCARSALNRLRRHLAGLDRVLTALSYQGVLARGFALVRDAGGEPVRSASAVSMNDPLEIEFADGRVPAVATGGAAPRQRRARNKQGQGSLF